MENVQLLLYILLVGLMVIGDAAFMETYKKYFRKNKAKTWENIIIAVGFSALATVILVFTNVYKPIFVQIGLPLWLDCLIFSIVFWGLQLWVDMSLVKKLISNIARELLEKAGLEEEQINDILNVAGSATKEKALK